MADDVSDEVPEADAMEQRRGLRDDEAVDTGARSGSMEVPEADALEQAQPAGDGGEHDR